MEKEKKILQINDEKWFTMKLFLKFFDFNAAKLLVSVGSDDKSIGSISCQKGMKR